MVIHAVPGIVTGFDIAVVVAIAAAVSYVHYYTI